MENYIETIYDFESHPKTSYPQKLINYLIKRYAIPKEAKLIDIGSGRGDFLFAFREKLINAQGIDMFEDIYDNETNEKIIFGHINVEKDNLPFEDNSLDIIFNKSILEHIHNPEKFFKECYRVLKPGGRIISMVPDWQSCMFIYYDDFTHVQPYTVTALNDALKMFGFKNVEAEIFYQLPIVWKYPYIKIICKLLQLFGPVKSVSKNKFYRFSRELMILASGIK